MPNCSCPSLGRIGDRAASERKMQASTESNLYVKLSRFYFSDRTSVDCAIVAMRRRFRHPAAGAVLVRGRSVIATIIVSRRVVM